MLQSRGMRGKYIVIEGHDGTGKSTQVDMLRDYLNNEHHIDTEEIHEPAGVPIADELRAIIKNGELQRDATTNLLLFTAARREIYRQKIAPALDRGAWVLAARNWISTVAYQGYGEGLDPDKIEQITREFTDPLYLKPDKTVLLNLADESERFNRIDQRGDLEKPDTFESRDEAFQQAVKNGYIKVAQQHSFQVIDASQTISHVHEEIVKTIQPLL